MKALLLLGCVAVAAASCGSRPSLVPLSNAEPEGNDVYFYGDASQGGKTRADAQQGDEKPVAKSQSAKRSTAERSGPTAPASKGDSEKGDAKADDAEKGEGAKDDAAEQAALPKLDATKLPGTYAGTDTLKIRLDGTPDRVETDPDAKLKVEAGDADTFAFQILDSRSGDALCSVDGTVVDGKLHFEPGQDCLETILGIPMTATLKSGTAKLEGEKLTIDWDIELEVDAPGGSRDGSIGYHFEGNKE